MARGDTHLNRENEMRVIMISVALFFALAAQAQVPVTPNPDHEAMLRHADPKLAANKRFVYDFWREVFEAAQMDLAPKYMAEGYIQNITKPDQRGSTMVVMHSTDRGRMHQPLKMSLGKQMVWAFSTTAEDTALRARLYDRVGVRRALELLSARFGASAVKELASRRLAMQDRGELDDPENLYDVVADEIVRDFSAAQLMHIRG